MLIGLAGLPMAAATTIALTLLGASPSEPGLEIVQTRLITATPAAVWAVIGAPCDVPRWNERVRLCTASHEGGLTTRTLHLRGGGTLAEVELDRDEEAMTYSYALERGPWPIKQLRATLTVSPQGEGSLVTWRATFRLRGACDEGAVADIEDLFRVGLAGLAREVAR